MWDMILYIYERIWKIEISIANHSNFAQKKLFNDLNFHNSENLFWLPKTKMKQ